MCDDITKGEIINTFKHTHKWKSPGKDKATNFWFNHLSSTYQLMTKFISEIIKDPKEMSDWLTEWVIYTDYQKEKKRQRQKTTNQSHAFSKYIKL